MSSAFSIATERAELPPPSGSEHATDSARFVKTTVVGLDIATVVLGVTFATVLYLAIWGDLSWASARTYLVVGLLSSPAWIFGFVKNRLYSARFLTRGVDETRRVVRGVFVGTLGLAVATVAIQTTVERGWLVVTFLACLTFVGIERGAMRKVFDKRRETGRMQRRVVLIGDTEEANSLYAMLASEPRLGYTPVAMIPGPLKGDLVATDSAEAEYARLHEGIRSVLDLVDEVNASSVLIAASSVDLSVSNALIRALSDEGVHVELSSTLLDVAPERLTVRPLGGFPIVYLEPVHRGGWRAFAKRAFDIVFALTLVLLSLPFVVVAAIAVKLTSPGPVFFRQERVGRDGKPFTILKLRTMVDGAANMLDTLREQNEAAGPLFKMRDDPRVTPVGAFLRKTSIDELPQLWNVLSGKMSMVGPRPALASEVESWPSALHGRLRVKPGLTGMWQVSGRDFSAFEDYVRLDLYYVDNWSLLTDVLIVVQTVPAVLLRRGSY